MDGLTRRDLLATTAVAVAACGVGGLAGCADTRKERQPLITSGTVSLGPATDYPAGTVSTKYVETYGIVVVNDSGTPAAIRPVCTHKGCTVVWKPEGHQFECPCHGSRFNLIGQPVNGPATRPLPAVACIRRADGTVAVDLTKLYAL